MSSGVHTFFTHCEWEEGASSSSGWQRHWRSGRSNRRCEPPQIGPHDKGAIERDLHPWQRSNTVGLEHLTKGQQRGFARLSGCVDWAKALDKGGRSSWKSAYTLFLTVWTVRLLGTQLFKTDAWQSSDSIEADRREWGSTKDWGLKNKFKLWNLSLTWILNYESILIISNFIIPPIQIQMQSVRLGKGA